jgi:lysophospholipase L1-like esterase
MNRAAILALTLFCCGDEQTAADAGIEAEFTSAYATPASGSSSGYFAVTLDLTETGVDPVDVVSVRFGENMAYDLTPEGSNLEVVVQGNPTPGPVEVVVETDDETTRLGEAFLYDEPLDPRFERVVTLGASLTQGVQRGVPSFHGTLMSPAAQIVRQMGGYFPVPLLIDGLMPQIEVDIIGPPPGCAVPDIIDVVTQGAVEIIPFLQDETGTFRYDLARVDPDIEVHNVAVGGSLVADILRGPETSNTGVQFVSHLVYEPYGAFMRPVDSTQIELVEALEPTLIISTDFFYNDIANSILVANEIDPEAITPLDELGADIPELVERLAATGAEVFLSNMPSPSILPAVAEKGRQMRDADYTPGEIEERVEAIDALARQINEILEDEVAEYENVHLVDLYTGVGDLRETGLDANGTRFTTDKFGGLLGLDGVHFTDTGYALIANYFIDAINLELGTEIPTVDLDAIAAQDPETPDRLRALGLDPADCE